MTLLIDSELHAVPTTTGAVFTWDYGCTSTPLARLYDKAKSAQWDSNDLPWHINVDQEALSANIASLRGGFGATDALVGTVFESWADREWMVASVEAQNWALSQFLHGEQGALLTTSKLVECAPTINAKYFAATQVFDEARHVEVFARYLDTKLSGHYPVNTHVRSLLDDILADSRWDVTYLGMQVLVEGLALAAFGVIRQVASEPLLTELLRRVMTDEARHVAFGVISLTDVYAHLSAAELRERQEFTYEAVIRMRDRFAMQEVWERLGVPVEDGTRFVVESPEQQMFQRLLFARVVPNCRKLGLLDAGDGWLRQRFTELGIIAFEHCTDAEEEGHLERLVAGP